MGSKRHLVFSAKTMKFESFQPLLYVDRPCEFVQNRGVIPFLVPLLYI